MAITTPYIGRKGGLEIGRRRVLAGAGAVLILPTTLSPLTAADSTTPVVTPQQTPGPFYPVDWDGDIDNDLVQVRGEAAAALGQVVNLQGRVMTAAGAPVAGAEIAIWQCDAQGIYRHPWDATGGRKVDAGFQSRGQTKTDASGFYSFRTIRPVAYPGRTPHIHFKVITNEGDGVVTQMYVMGEPLNDTDGILNAIADQRARQSLIVALTPADRIEQGSFGGTFDIVLG